MAAMFREFEEFREIKNSIDLNKSALPESNLNGSYNPALCFPNQIQRQCQGQRHRRISAASNREDDGIMFRDLSLKPALPCKEEPLELLNSNNTGSESPWLPNKLRLFQDFQLDSNHMSMSNPKDNGQRLLPKSMNPAFCNTNTLDFMKAPIREESLLPENERSIFDNGSIAIASSSSVCKANTREFMNLRSRDDTSKEISITSSPPNPFCNGNTREFMTMQSREVILPSHKHSEEEEEEGIITIAGSIGNGTNTREFLKVHERPALEEVLARPFCNGNGGEFTKAQIRESFLLPNQGQRSVLGGVEAVSSFCNGKTLELMKAPSVTAELIETQSRETLLPNKLEAVSSFCNGKTLELMKAPSVTAELIETQSRETLLPNKLRLFQDFLGQQRSFEDEKSTSNDTLVSNMELSSLSIGGGGGPSSNLFQHGDVEQHQLEQSKEALLPNKLRLFQDFMAKQPPVLGKRRRSRGKASSSPQNISPQEQYGNNSMLAAGSAVERWYLDDGESSQAPVGGVPLFADRILEQYQRRLGGTSDVSANLVSGGSEYLSMRARKERAGRNHSFLENPRSKNKLQIDPLANTTPIFHCGSSYKEFLAPKQPGKLATDPYIIVDEELDDNNQDNNTPQTDGLAQISRDFLSEGFPRRNGPSERSFIMQELDELAAKNPWGVVLHGQNARDNDALSTDIRIAKDFLMKESDIWNQESLINSADCNSSALKESCSRDLLKLGNLSRELLSDRQCNAEGETDTVALEMSVGNCQQRLLQNQQDEVENPLSDGMRGSNKDMMEGCNKESQSDAFASKQIESPSWLPPGWITISKLRKAGHTAGTTDKYYINPVTGRRFRSKNEVMRFLDTGQPNRSKQDILDLQMLDSSALALATRKEWMNDPSLYPDMSRDYVLGKQQSDDRFGGSNPVTTEFCVEGSSRTALVEGSNATQNYHMEEALEGQAYHYQSKLLQESCAKTTMPLYLLSPFVDPKALLKQRFHQLDERQLYFRNVAKPILFSSAKAKESTGAGETGGKLWNSAMQQGKRSSSTLTGTRKQQKLNPKFERELLVALGRKLCQQSLGRAAQTSGIQGS